ncbi:2'-5' RNA ligase [Corynebacterium deserti GIMN1.010]|uniref:RNA 2',3'-cyclic phosphodiesterase n=1 Tax=Corynebacterium deserti GIMN1.010 TaxID=931089 RepID=A0A0M4CYH3_9CORY|nr:RNA 2',3'-cyclic phosphodiesterase [Corynebacterium deserti]ALC06487.1 2'-5' RNA ligase [Corynebacterium deserti GIMN1.010]
MRLFAAITPPIEVTEHLVKALRPYRDDLRWADPDNWHITLAFYGEMPDGAVEDLVEHLTVAARMNENFTIRVKGAGSFNRKNLWMGVGGDTKDLRRLMADCLIDPEERKRQRAHLTVATPSQRQRGKAWDPVIPDLVHALSVYEGPDWPVEEIELVQSEPGKGRSGGPLYTTVATITLSSALV